MRVERLRYDSRDGVRPILLVGPVNDIGMSQYEIGDGQLHTTGASSCIVMAAHNEATQRSIVGHFPVIGGAFHNAVNDLPKLGDSAKTEVWLGGGEPLVEEGEDMVEPDKFQAVKAISGYLGRLGLSESLLRIDWSDKGRVIDVELDCALGLLVVHDYPASFEAWDEAVERRRAGQQN